MAFPSVAATAVTNGTAATTAPVVNLPTGIVAGQTLLVLFRCAVVGAIGWPADWTEMDDGAADASDDQTALAWRKADGTEGATITLSSGNGKFVAIAYRIPDAADPTVTPPEQTGQIGTGTSVDPLGRTPPAGAQDYLWLWLGGWDGEQVSPPAGNPTNYTNPIGANSGTAGAVTTNCRVAGAERQLNAASENPPAWVISAAPTGWTTYTTVIHPAPPAVPRVPRATPYPQLLAH